MSNLGTDPKNNEQKKSIKRSLGTPEKKKRIRGESSLKVTHRAQNYRTEWENDDILGKWICPVKNNKGKAMCRLCNSEMLAEITVLKRHSTSQKHIKIARGMPEKGCSLDKFVRPTGSETALEKNVKLAEIKISAYLSEHNMSFNSVDHLIKVIKSSFPDSEIAKNISLGRTKSTNVVKNVIGQCCFEEMCDHLKNNKFSLIIDESTDIGMTKSLCICVRYFCAQEEKVVSKFWSLVDIFDGSEPDVTNKGANAERLFYLVMETLKKGNVPLSNVVGFASDGCNTMMGEINSVQQKLTNEMPGLIVQKCICHSIHLCASKACTALPRKCEDLARNIYGVLKNSSKRIAMLAEFQHFCDVDPHRILRLSQTRWLSLLAVVQRILEQWDALRLFFTKMWFEERSNAAEMIYQDLQDPFVKLFYYFLDWVLPKFINLNKLFQGEKVLITFMHNRMVSDYRELLCSYMKREYVLKTNIGNIDPGNASQFLHPNVMYLGVNVLNGLQDNDIANEKEKVDDFLVRCRTFLVTACKEIKKRYDFDHPVYSKLHVFNPKHALGDEQNREPTLLPIMKQLSRICSSDTYQRIDDQWRKLPDIKPVETSDMDPDRFWATVLVYQDPIGELEFKELAQFALDVLVLPHSSANCERVFSKVNLLKTKLRNKLKTPMLNALIHSDQKVKAVGCFNFKPSEKMLKSMTKTTLYGDSQKKIGESHGTRSSNNVSELATEFCEEDMYYGLSSDSD